MRPHWPIPPLAAILFSLAVVAQPSLDTLDLRVTDADIQPAVTITEHGNRTVEEFSVNNNTYMIKVTPAIGAPYYLVDEDGSGEMAWRRGGAQIENNVPQWTLLSW